VEAKKSKRAFLCPAARIRIVFRLIGQLCAQ
jgi:hypothetical protein